MGQHLPADKHYSEACERNWQPIAQVLSEILPSRACVLEIGSGSGQHAVRFAGQFPGVEWRPSDRPGCVGSVAAWRDEAELENLLPPIEIDLLDKSTWPDSVVDAVVAFNVLHIAPWPATTGLLDLAASVLCANGLVYLYGPFRYDAKALEASNESFDRYLREVDPAQGIRCFEEVDRLAIERGFELTGDRSMPANNRSLWWKKSVA